jgi:hypothetical protein
MCQSALNDRPYAALLSQKDKSDYWIYTQLLQRDLNPPVMLCDSDWLDIRQKQHWKEMYDELGENPPMEEIAKYFRRPSPLIEWIHSVPQDLLICTFDDFSVSGSVIKNMFPDSRRVKTNIPGRFHAFICYATNPALKFIEGSDIVAHVVSQNIPTLSPALDAKELEFIEQQVDIVNGDGGGISKNSAVLFWTWYKVPDNIPDIFTGKGFPPLIRTERFQPPYK